jgi:hypothetical protein
MLITFAEAAKLAGVSKGAIRKAALDTRKLKAERDEQGVWRIDAADVQRLWPQRPAMDTITDLQQSPVTVSDTHQDATVISVLQAKLEAAEQRIADKDAVIDDLRTRLDAEAEERRRLTLLLTDQRPTKRSWWSWRQRS